MAKVAIRTINGNYVTAVNGGGMGEAANVLPIHTDATWIQAWEKFKITFQDNGYCTIQTQTGNYLTAVNGGGIGNPANTDPVHTDQTEILDWERFELIEVEPGIYAFQTEKGNSVTAVNGGGMGEAANKCRCTPMPPELLPGNSSYSCQFLRKKRARGRLGPSS
jgi:hypothetical protein